MVKPRANNLLLPDTIDQVLTERLLFNTFKRTSDVHMNSFYNNYSGCGKKAFANSCGSYAQVFPHLSRNIKAPLFPHKRLGTKAA